MLDSYGLYYKEVDGDDKAADIIFQTYQNQVTVESVFDTIFNVKGAR